MAIQSKLLVDGVYYNLKSFDYGFVKDADDQGLANGKTRQAGITCVIDAVREDVFEDWAFSGFMKKNVEIHMVQTITGMGKTRVLKLHDTFLLGLTCSYSSTTERPMAFQLQMKSGAIESSASTAAHVEQWSQLPNNAAETTVIEEELEGQILEVYYENKEDSQISRIRKNKEIYLVVKTENMTGKTIDVDLSDDAFNFEYKGEILENDQLVDYQVTSDVVRIPLKTIKQS